MRAIEVERKESKLLPSELSSVSVRSLHSYKPSLKLFCRNEERTNETTNFAGDYCFYEVAR